MIVGLGYQLVTGSGHMPKAAYCTRRFSCGEGIAATIRTAWKL